MFLRFNSVPVYVAIFIRVPGTKNVPMFVQRWFNNLTKQAEAAQHGKIPKVTNVLAVQILRENLNSFITRLLQTRL